MTVAEVDPIAIPERASVLVAKAPQLAAVGRSSVRPSLSSREVEVLLAWLASESKEDAAARLFISASTVSTHISRIRAKYGAVSRPAPTKAHLLARALQDGYTTLDVW
ncbi:response regulator transcription factor [Gordonia humi]|uniref:DNA-binding CsgD family transcriptional regulator n=1 Tax=Gordonia humi TaxID=686429 RepID=A0A840F4W7_9ACTN|nr:helix-turn-helix transcriptional regulator [Gordonia humi]MBB4135300.1 DNA-binding CsgD family transcriptional regulator [Gordonia humi]